MNDYCLKELITNNSFVNGENTQELVEEFILKNSGYSYLEELIPTKAKDEKILNGLLGCNDSNTNCGETPVKDTEYTTYQGIILPKTKLFEQDNKSETFNNFLKMFEIYELTKFKEGIGILLQDYESNKLSFYLGSGTIKQNDKETNMNLFLTNIIKTEENLFGDLIIISNSNIGNGRYMIFKEDGLKLKTIQALEPRNEKYVSLKRTITKNLYSQLTMASSTGLNIQQKNIINVLSTYKN